MRENIQKLNDYRQSFREAFDLTSTVPSTAQPTVMRTSEIIETNSEHMMNLLTIPSSSSSSSRSSSPNALSNHNDNYKISSSSLSPSSPPSTAAATESISHASRHVAYLAENLNSTFIPVVNLNIWVDNFLKLENPEAYVQETREEIELNYKDLENLDFTIKRYDISRLILLKGFGYSIDCGLHYLLSLLYSVKLKSLIYLGLSVGYESTETTFDDQHFTLIFEDIYSHQLPAMKWLALTRAKFSQPMMDSLVTYLKTLIFQSVLTTNLVRLASGALLNLLRLSQQYKLQLPSFQDVIHRFEIIFPRFQLSSGHGANLISIAKWIAIDQPQHAEALANELSKYLNKLVDEWSVSPDMYHTVIQATRSLDFFQILSYRVSITKKSKESLIENNFAIPTWWTILQLSIMSILTKLSTESRVVTQSRCANLVVSLQIGALQTLLAIFKNQFQSSVPYQSLHYFSCPTIENGIIFGSLLPHAFGCFSHILEQTEPNLLQAGVTCLSEYGELLSFLRNQEVFRLHKEVLQFQDQFAVLLEKLSLQMVESIQQEKLRDSPDIIREYLICLIQYGNMDVCHSIQVLLHSKLRDEPSAKVGSEFHFTTENRRREYTRGLLLCAQRTYVQSLQLIATTSDATFVDFTRNWNGCTPQLLSLPELPPHSTVPNSSIVANWISHLNSSPKTIEHLLNFQQVPYQEINPAGMSSKMIIEGTKEDKMFPTQIEKALSRNYDDALDSSSPAPTYDQQETVMKTDTPRRSSLRWFANSKKESNASPLTHQNFRSESLHFQVLESFIGKCRSNGTMESARVLGKVIMSSKVNEESICEIGLNLNHPQSFPQIEKRVRDTVAVEFLSPNIDVVRKLDPRGSCFVTTPPGSSDNICILCYEMRDVQSPLVIHSQAHCTNDAENQLNTNIYYDFKFVNASNVFTITQIIASVAIPVYEKILSSEYLTSEGQKSNNLKPTITNGSRHFSITCLKVKPQQEIALSLTIKASGVSYNRFGLLDQKLRALNILDTNDHFEIFQDTQVTFSLQLADQHEEIPTTSPLSGVSLRYFKVSGNKKISTRLSFDRKVESYTAQIIDRTNETASLHRFVTLTTLHASLPTASPRISKNKLFRAFSRSTTSSTIPSETEKQYQSLAAPLSMSMVQSETGSFDCNATGESNILQLDNSSATIREDSTSVADDNNSYISIPHRPWNWEADALELEKLDIEKDKYDNELDEIEARALAPMDCNAVYNTLSRIHSKLPTETSSQMGTETRSTLGSTSGSISRGISRSQSEIMSSHRSQILRSSSSISSTGGDGLNTRVRGNSFFENRKGSLDSFEEDDEIDRPDEEMNRFFASSSMVG